VGILSGLEIKRQVELGNIAISDFDPKRLGPNSYDVRIGHQLALMLDEEFDLTVAPTKIDWFTIPDAGYLLQPRLGYLGHVLECIVCKGCVPWFDGRSTSGRYFLQVHQTAGRGDELWAGQFTMELMAMYKPVRVYTGLSIAQLSFFSLEGESSGYQGRYNNQLGPTLPKPLKRN